MRVVTEEFQGNCVEDDSDCWSLFEDGTLTLYTQGGNNSYITLSAQNARKLAQALLRFAEESQCESAKSSEP